MPSKASMSTLYENSDNIEEEKKEDIHRGSEPVLTEVYRRNEQISSKRSHFCTFSLILTLLADISINIHCNPSQADEIFAFASRLAKKSEKGQAIEVHNRKDVEEETHKSLKKLSISERM